MPTSVTSIHLYQHAYNQSTTISKYLYNLLPTWNICYGLIVRAAETVIELIEHVSRSVSVQETHPHLIYRLAHNAKSDLRHSERLRTYILAYHHQTTHKGEQLRMLDSNRKQGYTYAHKYERRQSKHHSTVTPFAWR
jgi:hypothetical protein